MKSGLLTVSKIYFCVYFVLTSVYCLLSSIPYTYFFLIKEPPYEWLMAFARYQPLLCWLAVFCLVFVKWKKRNTAWVRAMFAATAGLAVYLTAHNFILHIKNGPAAYVGALMFLLPIILAAAQEIFGSPLWKRNGNRIFLSYSNAVFIALIVTAISSGSVALRHYREPKAFELPNYLFVVDEFLTGICLALLLVSVANLLLPFICRITGRPWAVIAAVGTFISLGLGYAASRFLENNLSFHGWQNYLYAACIGASLALAGSSIFASSSNGRGGNLSESTTGSRIVPYAVAACLCALGLIMPIVIGEKDWNGILQGTFTLVLWIGVSICLYLARPIRKSYSIPAIVTVALIGGVIYWTAGETSFLWAKQLGHTNEEVERSLQTYATQNVSFKLAHSLLRPDSPEPCEALCMTLRQYTNVKDAEVKSELALVSKLEPAKQERPNIFFIVVDSLRPDYLGIYNSKVDFTPNLDRFAQDSIVMRNAYTQYAGTSLSEPAIWSGALLLHAHYLQPFDKVNSLKKLLKTDGYRMIVSYDEVLQQVLPEEPDLIKFDTGILWNHLEISSSLGQLETYLDARKDKDRPIFFYTQPKNVHQFGVNDRPKRNSSNWKDRPGFNNRIAYTVHQVDESLGPFFDYLKAKNLYDNSIIVVTADHGDATGGFGLFTHSTFITPEIMRVPLVIHLPRKMRQAVSYDPNAISSLIDLTPSLYYLLGHGPVRKHPLIGQPLFTNTKQELDGYSRTELFLASDSRAGYGLLMDHGTLMFVTYDSPAQGRLFDMRESVERPPAESVKTECERRIMRYLQDIADFYGYKPTGG